MLLDQRAALVAVRLAEPGHHQSQVVVDLGDRGDRAAGVLVARPLVDTDRRLQAIDQIDIGSLALVKELPRIDRERLDVLPLPFRKQRVQGQTAFARSAGAGDHHQLLAWDIEVDMLEVMDAGAADSDGFRRACRARGGGFWATGDGHEDLDRGSTNKLNFPP